METIPAAVPASPATAPVLRPEAPAPKREASIGKSVVIKGDIYSKEDLLLDGNVNGTVDMPGNRLTVGVNGKVQATIKAREVVVLGAVQGDVEAGERIVIRKDAHLEGNLKSASISIEDGAYFKGSIDIIRPAQVKATLATPAMPVAPKPLIQEPGTPTPPISSQARVAGVSQK